MRAIVVDDEQWAIEEFRDVVKDISLDLIGSFTSCEQALGFVAKNRIDIAFLDIEMPVMSGIDLARNLRQIWPDIFIVYITSYDNRFLEAYSEGFDDFVMKPYTREQIEKVLRRISPLNIEEEPLLTAEMFGEFSIRARGNRLKLKKSKAWEILAILMDRCGNAINKKELCEILWGTENEVSASSNFRSCMALIRKVLADADASDFLGTTRFTCYLNLQHIRCEYTDIMSGKLDIRDSTFRGNYLPEYEWAQKTNQMLIDMIESKKSV